MKTKAILNHSRLFLMAFFCLMVSTACFADKPISVEQLPASAKKFIQANFPNNKILLAKKDYNSYECRLADGTKLEFKKNGEWDKVDCKVKAVPAALVPAAIQKYVAANFPDTKITKIDKERYGFEVELSNKLDLKFNAKGTLIGIDD